MNPRTTITLSKTAFEQAQSLVDNELYASVGDVVEAALEQMLDKQVSDVLLPMKDELLRRMQLPHDQFVSLEDSGLFERLEMRLERGSEKGHAAE